MRYPLLLLVFALGLFLPGLFSLPMDDRDSAHNAQATKQMVQTHQYFQIRFQDTTRFQKPPGMNWLQALCVHAFSDGDSNLVWPYRLPSALGGFFSLFLLYFMTRKRLGEKTAFLASILLGSTLLLTIESHLIVIDAMLLVSVILMQGSLWACYDAYREQRTAHWYWWSLFWLAMSWGICLKGITPLVGLSTVAALAFWHRDWGLIKCVKPLWGLLLLLISSLWVLGVNQAEHSNYLWQLVQKDLLPKLKGGHESHGMPPGYHFLLLPLTFWPASLFLWRGVVHGFRERRSPLIGFLLCWILPTWIFFECMPTKLPQYVLPTFPALAMLCALAINDQRSAPGLKLLTVLWWILSLVLAGLFLYLPVNLLQHSLLVSTITATAVAVLATVAWRSPAITTTAFLAVIAFYGLFQGTLPYLDPLWTTEKIAAITKPLSVNAEHPLLSVGYEEPSLVFVLGTNAVRYESPNSAAEWAKQHPDSILLLDHLNKESVTEQLAMAGRSLQLINSIHSFNYSKGEWLELSIYQVA